MLKRAIYECLRDSSYFHYRFREVFSAAGFEVRHVEKVSCHPVWNIKLGRGTFELARDCLKAARQIRRLLDQHRLMVERNAIAVVQNGNYILCSFVFPNGCEGDLPE